MGKQGAEGEEQSLAQAEQQEQALQEFSESGLKEEIEGLDDEELNMRRQETVNFQIDEKEVSFNAYRAIIEDRQGRCYLQTKIDYNVKLLHELTGIRNN